MVHHYPEELVKEIASKAQQFRVQVLKMVYNSQSGHLGGAFSCAEIITCLYFQHMKVDPSRPDWPERDRLLFSKGHACAMLYTALANKGFFPIEELMTFRKFRSRLQGHPEPAKTPGVETVAGPLGHGIAIGIGMALAGRMPASQKPSSMSAPTAMASTYRVYVLIGDGEINAGLIWEGAMAAAKFRLGNLTAILDYNGIQQTGATADVMPTEPIADKWTSFGWHVQEIHGHNVLEILTALDRADEVHARPSIIIARTTKGKGVSFMEYNSRWHGMPPNNDQYQQALRELEEGLR
ncbi:MAG: transketolase [Planctomycetota bacterium]|jgi:transketolase